MYSHILKNISILICIVIFNCHQTENEKQVRARKLFLLCSIVASGFNSQSAENKVLATTYCGIRAIDEAQK